MLGELLSLNLTILSNLLSQAVASLDDAFWDRYWSNPAITASDIFSMITRSHVSDLMTKASGNLTALCFKVYQWIDVFDFQ